MVTIYEKTDKRRIYELIDLYLSQGINAWTFCSEYHTCYGIEIDLDTLNDAEEKAFKELAIIAGRFSPFEEDHKKYPGTYFTEDELRQKIIETKKILIG